MSHNEGALFIFPLIENHNLANKSVLKHDTESLPLSCSVAALVTLTSLEERKWKKHHYFIVLYYY